MGVPFVDRGRVDPIPEVRMRFAVSHKRTLVHLCFTAGLRLLKLLHARHKGLVS